METGTLRSIMHRFMTIRLDNKLECPQCRTLYLTLTDGVSGSTPIHCSSCGPYLGSWAELEQDFFRQGRSRGVFEMREGQIVRKD